MGKVCDKKVMWWRKNCDKKHLAIDKSYNAKVKIRKLCDREKNYMRKKYYATFKTK